MSIRLFTPFGMILGMCLLLSCRGENERAEEPQAPIQASASVETGAPATNMVPAADSDADFIVFDGMHLRNKPAEIAEAGLVPIEIIYPPHIFGKNNRELRSQGSMALPNREVVTEIAQRMDRNGRQIGVIDIEHWPTTGPSGQEGLPNYLTVLQWFQESAPGIQWGYYGVVPFPDLRGSSYPPSSPYFRRWISRNESLRGLARNVDVLFPSLYATGVQSPEEWARSAETHIREARRLNPNVPVYPFLWPQYHDGSERQIEADFWRLQLETVHAHADGVVIWHAARYTWDPEAPWWKETKSFVRSLD